MKYKRLRTRGRTRNSFSTIKQFKQFNPIWNTIRDQDDQMLMKPESRAERWKRDFERHGARSTSSVHQI